MATFSEKHPNLVNEQRGDMTGVLAPRTGGGYDPATDGNGFHFPDPDTIQGVPLAVINNDAAKFLGL